MTEIRRFGVASLSPADPFALLRETLDADGVPGPLPFTGGAIGYFSYDLARRIERLPNVARDEEGIPEMAVGIYDWAVLVETRPIKGTRPRAAAPEADAALAGELLASIKDRAENLMIVDLLRNDLGKVCVPGSVAVPRLFGLESFATVHHLVSTVTGRLAPGFDAVDLLRAAFPGGSITGAPKLRAMEIIEELEPNRRGVYCGAIGWLGFNGDMDTSIAIRTLVSSEGRMRFWAGGGIVADSEVEAEYQECLDKAAALMQFLEQHGAAKQERTADKS